MAENFGTGVSRVLDPTQTSYLVSIWQQGKPPLDSELNLIQQISNEWNRIQVLRGTPSGWLTNDTNVDQDYVTNPIWSNWFQFGRQKSGETQAIPWAVVNGWLLPITGTQTGTPPGSPNNTDTWNRITLSPPPGNTGDFRIDFVFLEAWLARVPPNPSTTNKPAASAVFRYGNVEGGYSFIPDDLVDPAIGFETSQRVQVQYRIRVVTGLVGLSSYPDGFDPSIVKGQGAAASPTTYTYANMRQVLGDPGLWRAGDGTANSLGTVDGYTYAIPISALFRRNLVSWDADPSQNLNGGFNRNPTAVDRTGWKTFSTTPTLAANLTNIAPTLTLTSATNIPLPLSPATPVFIQIGDEILSYQVITGTTMTLVARGTFGTKAEQHFTGDTITVLSGRPDGLFSDQIAKTDILDLRHAVNPNGFDYEALLKHNFDKLLRGQLRSNWKKSGGGPQGPFVFYTDKITAGGAALGVTKLDAPDNIRMVFSDAAMLQKVEAVVTPDSAGGLGVNITESWGLTLTATANQAVANVFTAGDVLTIPIVQFKNGLPGGDGDQVRFINDSIVNAVTIRIDGYPETLVSGTHFTLSPANPTSLDNLLITLVGPVWAANTTNAPASKSVYITLHVQYGGGRGLSRRPDSLHSVAYLNPMSEHMASLSGIPLNNIPMRVSWVALWSKYTNATVQGLLPSTAEAYGDLGSKTVILTPFRRVDYPNTIWAYDGTNLNPNYSLAVSNGSAGFGVGSTTFTDAGATFLVDGVVVGDALDIFGGAGTAIGLYRVTGAITPTSFTVDRVIPVAVGLSYNVHHTQGVMPLNNLSGAVKWTTTDPLSLFSGTTDGTASRKNIFVRPVRHLIPGWGEVKVPILWQNSLPEFYQGINFVVRAKEGGSPGDDEKNFVAYSNGPKNPGFSTFSTLDLVPNIPAVYNALLAAGPFGEPIAGIRKFTDTRGLGREGLELPPFYGIARLAGVYEAQDYKINNSPFGYTTRAAPGPGTAVNLLRQDITEAAFWIEMDADGDSTFILNANALDLAKSPNPIANFGAGDYVIEATIFGFDRGSFKIGSASGLGGPDAEFRLVLTRARTATQAASATRDDNYLRRWDGTATGTIVAGITAPTLVVPGPLQSGEVAITYSRQPYLGDAWGSQTLHQDTGYTPGPLQAGIMYQLTSTVLDEAALTRPNQKPVEVLAALRFTTTAGTGRLSGFSASPSTLDFRNVGYEDFVGFPPPTPVTPRPRVIVGVDFDGENSGTDYLGCVERLPLGATFRDKDFRGEPVTSPGQPFLYHGGSTPGTFVVSQAVNSSLEQTEINLSTSSVTTGAPGEIVVHVDGEPGNYGVLTNFRVNRGGSLFTASGSHPGGEFASLHPEFEPSSTPRNVLGGVAMLVRNQVTSIGATEVSAGDELMLVIVTSGLRSQDLSESFSIAAISTSGSAEGISAADLYRIQGRPLLRDNERIETDPNIPLSKAVSIGGN